MSSNQQAPYSTVELVFWDQNHQQVHGGVLMFANGIPIPDVGEQVIFHGQTYTIASREFSYKHGGIDQIADVKVLFMCK